MKVNNVWVFAAVGGVVLMAALTLSQRSDVPAGQSSQETGEEGAVSRDAVNEPANAKDVRRPIEPPVGGRNSLPNLSSAGDYQAFVKNALGAARAGDANAQFNVWKATNYCDENGRFYFIRGEQKLSREEGLAWAIRRNVPYTTAQRVYDRCHAFLESETPIDTAESIRWLNAAAEQGHPVAQSILAAKILEEKMLRGFEGTSGAESPRADVEKLDETRTPAELLQAAVRSREPEVLFRIGDMMTLLDPAAPDVSVQRLAWMAVACERGLDCSAQADWVAASCLTAECSSINSNTEVVRIIAGDLWSAVQQRARQLSEKLDAGRWEELGLSPEHGRG